MTDPVHWYEEPQWLFLVLIFGWVVVTGLLAHVGGWVSLAEKYAAENYTAEKYAAVDPPSGERFRFASGSMGVRYLPVSYGNCLFVTVGSRGLYLSILFPFRFMSPPLFLPWSSLEEVIERRFLLVRLVRIRVRDSWPQITLRGKSVTEAVKRAYDKSREQAG